MREHLETFLEHARETYEAPLPRYVEQELRGFLQCGVFAHGFVHAKCEACGHDLLVAFSCKGRGVCPSCAGRRMANTAAHLVDRVLPAVPVRQWVLSLPFELRMLAAFRADVLSALSRIFIESIFARYRARARDLPVENPECGAVTFVQRFGSSLNLHVHFHVMVMDGVFAHDAGGQIAFHAAPAPQRGELLAVARRVHDRAVRWLDRRGLLGSTLEAPSKPLHACAQLAMQLGPMRAMRLPDDGQEEDAEPLAVPRRSREAVEDHGFNLEAAVRTDADDDIGRERLMRYGARPPFSLERLRKLPGGRLAYRIKSVGYGRAKTRVMTSLELLARLCALIPPPRYPLVRYHGVLAPRSPWRRQVIPRAPSGRTKQPKCTGAASKPTERTNRREPRDSAQREGRAARPSPMTSIVAAAPVQQSGDVVILSPNVLSLRHWQRLLGGLLYAASPRVDWATLMRRSFAVDVLRCASCGGRLRVLGEVTEPILVRVVLERLGLEFEAPPVARARDPTLLLGDELVD